MLLLVRHGDAGDERAWDGPDWLRPLSPVGRHQAEGLVFRLEDYPVERILCSATLRCQQTVEPLARDRLLRVESLAALGVEASAAEVLADRDVLVPPAAAGRAGQGCGDRGGGSPGVVIGILTRSR